MSILCQEPQENVQSVIIVIERGFFFASLRGEAEAIPRSEIVSGALRLRNDPYFCLFFEPYFDRFLRLKALPK